MNLYYVICMKTFFKFLNKKKIVFGKFVQCELYEDLR